MRIGFHISIAGGFPLVVNRALEVGCTTFQIFSHSPRMWKTTPVPADDAAAFRAARSAAGIAPIFVHTSYLINLAATDDAQFEKSVAALTEEMERADILGAEYVVTHLGTSYAPRDAAVARVADSLRLAGIERFNARLLLENTACERGDVGCSFEDIAEIIRLSGIGSLGVTIDTCHSIGAGYDVGSADGLEAVVGLMDSTFGLDRVKLIHLNDSKHPLGSHRDRHEELGKGAIGEEAIGRILNNPRLRDIPFVMETPKSGPEDDIRNMAVALRLRALTS